MRFINIFVFILSFVLEVRVRAEAKESLHWVNENEAIYLKGEVRIENSKLKKLNTVYGVLSLDHAEIWVIPKEDKLLIRSVFGSVELQARDGQKILLENGYELLIGGITEDGKSWIEIPRPINLKDHLTKWKSDTTVTAAEFKKKVALFKSSWQKAVGVSSHAYQKNADRQIATIKKEQELQQAYEQKQQLRKAQTKKSFFQRTFER